MSIFIGYYLIGFEIKKDYNNFTDQSKNFGFKIRINVKILNKENDFF